MLDDTHGDDDIPRHARIALLRSKLIQRVRLLRKYSGTYVGYSIACALVWAVIFAGVFTQAVGRSDGALRCAQVEQTVRAGAPFAVA
jgi:hypothetical protein